METPYRMGETLNGTTGLDINHEKKLVEEKLDQLRVTEASPETITQTMKDMGLTRFYSQICVAIKCQLVLIFEMINDYSLNNMIGQERMDGQTLTFSQKEWER